ncbi:MAG: hypothetical protein ACJ8J7_02935, partial [Sulfurifustaceae bacterium]
EDAHLRIEVGLLPAGGEDSCYREHEINDAPELKERWAGGPEGGQLSDSDADRQRREGDDEAVDIKEVE